MNLLPSIKELKEMEREDAAKAIFDHYDDPGFWAYYFSDTGWKPWGYGDEIRLTEQEIEKMGIERFLHIIKIKRLKHRKEELKRDNDFVVNELEDFIEEYHQQYNEEVIDGMYELLEKLQDNTDDIVKEIDEEISVLEQGEGWEVDGK